MAAPGRHVGRYIQKNGRFLTNNFEQLWGHRSFGWSPALRQQATEAKKESTENIVVPRKKTWSKEAVLEALASTVGRDPTALHYCFQDDTYLSPKNASEFKYFTLAQESGKNAAKFFINNNPKFFTKDFAEPHIPCLMPKTVSLHLEEVSEEALKERINLRRVTAAVDMYDQLLQTGTAVSMETTHDLLDLICLYCDRNPINEDALQTEDVRESERRGPWRKIRYPQASELKSNWKEDNNAERIFKLLPERDTKCYSALIRGMVKHGAYAKAFSMYTDMLNDRLTGDVHIFNALILAVPDLKEKNTERWDLIVELLTQMNQQKIQPNLQTFNSVLKSLKRCASYAKTKSPLILNEMKAMGIAPSLATYDYILSVFCRIGPSSQHNTAILQEVMSELAGRSLTCQDPDDVLFFCNAMRVCLDNKDMELAYKVHSLVEVGENRKLLGEPFLQSTYYGRFFNLMCLMEHIDVVLKWYRQLIPSLYYPNTQGMMDLLQALDTDSRLDLLPEIWKDIVSLGHHNRADLVDEILTLMAREKHSPEVQESFATCALDVMNSFDSDKVKPPLEWTASTLSNITVLLLRAKKTQKAWNMLQLFKSNNRVPSVELLNEFLSVCHSEGSPQKAVDLVQLSAAFCQPATSQLAKRTLAEFTLTEEQRAILSKLEPADESSD
ncbi:pentatricopeptide repeat domain-containing protein 3, mitochondrial [Lates calcarifer]|nr:pentatricopeptide repeat domain-containing protein 3, mitochondrial [Lates calcarifer]